MSCMISSHDTINAVVHALDLDAAGMPRNHLSDRMEVSDGKFMDRGDLLGRELIILNLQAYKERYGISYELPGFTWKFQKYTKFDLWMACKFYLYQCSEGDLDKHPTYQTVQKTVELLSDSIIFNLPEIKESGWGLDETGQFVGPGEITCESVIY